MVSFDIIGEPKPQPRIKARVVNGVAMIYTPSGADDWKHTVRAFAIEALGPWPLIKPGVAVEVHTEFRLARPKSHFGTGRNSGKLKTSAPRRHTQTPDEDNLRKAVLDALGKFDKMPPLVWCDDCQVDGGRNHKRWTKPGEEPGLDIVIMEILPC